MNGVGEELPRGWVWVTLGEIAESVRNGIFVSRPGSEPNGVPILRISAVRPMHLDLGDLRYSGQDAESLREADRLALPGDLLFTRYNGNPDHVGACAAIPESAPLLTYPDKLIRVRVNRQVVDSRFVEFAFSWAHTRALVRRHAKTTAGQVGIAGGELKKIVIPMPPLGEQRRIVAALEEQLSRCDAGLRQLDQVRRKARKYRAAGEVGAIPLVSDSGHALPAGWQLKTLADIASAVGYGTSTKCSYDGAGEPVLRIPNVQGGDIDPTDLKYAVDSNVELSAYHVRAGDLLIVRTNGSKDLIGRVAVSREETKYAFASYLIRFRIRPDEAHVDWVASVLSSPRWRHLLEVAAASSAGQYNLNIKKLSALPIPLPPLSQQQKILGELSEAANMVRRFEKIASGTKETAAALRMAILSEAFAGQLVPPDPSDEPADMLLARIRAEQAAVPTQRRARRVAPAPRKASKPHAPTTTPTAPLTGQQTALNLEMPS